MDFVIIDSVLIKCYGKDRDVAIPDGVTSIGEYLHTRILHLQQPE